MIVKEINGVSHVIDSAFYAVRRNSRVTLTVEVGDFQAGGTAYEWKGKTVTGDPNFTDQPVNPAKTKIAGTIMHCESKVLDIRPDTNRTSVTYTLKGGVEDQEFPYGVQVPSEHGLAVYQVTFIFVEQAT